MQSGRISAFGLAAITPILGLLAAAQTGDPLMAIQQRLRTEIKLTRTLADRSDIVTAGSIVELRADGLLMYGVDSPLAPSNTYKDGRITQGAKGFGKDFAITFLSQDGTTASDYARRKFVAGEKVWVTSIEVLKDGVLFQLYSDVYDDVRYYANLKIPFANKKEVPPVEAVVQALADVLSVAPADAQSDQSSVTAAGPAPATAPARVAPAAPLPVIAPPAPPVDAPTPTIGIGQSPEQVTAAFGQPQRMAKVGVKQIYYYKEMKVTFTSGKVSNVE